MTTESNRGSTSGDGVSSNGEYDTRTYDAGDTNSSTRAYNSSDNGNATAVSSREGRGDNGQYRDERLREHPNTNRETTSARPVNVAVAAERQDGVRWGPIWAGLLTALTTFLLLELLFYALGWLTLDPGSNNPGTTRWLVTGILALVAFFVGGLVAGATTIWRGMFSGLLHGFMVWALGVAAFIALTFFGGSALLGSFGSLAHELGVGPQQVQSTTHVSPSEANTLANNAKDVSAPAFWGLFLPLASSMLGGLIGSKMWPRRKDSDPETVRLRS